MGRICRKALSGLLTASLLFSSFPSAVFAQEVTLAETHLAPHQVRAVTTAQFQQIVSDQFGQFVRLSPAAGLMRLKNFSEFSSAQVPALIPDQVAAHALLGLLVTPEIAQLQGKAEIPHQLAERIGLENIETIAVAAHHLQRIADNNVELRRIIAQLRQDFTDARTVHGSDLNAIQANLDRFFQNSFSAPDAFVTANQIAMPISISTLRKTSLLPTGEHVETTANRGPPELSPSSFGPESGTSHRNSANALRLTGSFFASLFPSPRYNTNTLLNRAKFGLRIAGVKFVLVFVLITLAERLGWHEHSNYHLPETNAAEMFMVGMVVAPVVEEVIFRAVTYGLVRDFLTKRIGKIRSILFVGAANSFLFAILHESADPVLMAVRILGTMGLIYAFQKGGLVSSITAHAVFNFLVIFPLDILAKGFGLSDVLSMVATILIYISLLIVAWLHDLLSGGRFPWRTVFVKAFPASDGRLPDHSVAEGTHFERQGRPYANTVVGAKRIGGLRV